jgi:hypothetical protein
VIIDMPLHNQESWHFDEFEKLRLQINTEDALEVIEYMKQLAEFSPPILRILIGKSGSITSCQAALVSLTAGRCVQHGSNMN